MVVEVKQLSKYFILHRKRNKSFEWQEDYGAVSCSQSDLPEMTKYMDSQMGYHKKKSFKEEFEATLQQNEIEYRQEDLLEFYD